MDKEKIKSILIDNGYEVIVDRKYGHVGYRLKVKQGSAVICYDSGKITVHGKLKEPLELLLKKTEKDWKYNDKVFVVYGHDDVARFELVDMLTDWGLTPLMIDQLPTEGNTIIEQLEHYIPQAAYGIVLATPDDIGRDRFDKKEKYRARQNVVLELGMLYATLGRKRVSVIIKKEDDFEKPSDIDGVIYIQFAEHISEVSKKLKNELARWGYRITNT